MIALIEKPQISRTSGLVAAARNFFVALLPVSSRRRAYEYLVEQYTLMAQKRFAAGDRTGHRLYLAHAREIREATLAD